MTKAIITGGCGFIGHHLIEHLLKNTGWELYILDRLTYAAKGFDRVRDIDAFDDRRCTFFTIDLASGISDGVGDEICDAEYVFHLAAETHVDNSIVDPLPFVKANVLGTCQMLEFARIMPNLKGLLYFSTDEVFGPALLKDDVEDPRSIKPMCRCDHNEYYEWDRYNSTNPYSATKAGGEELTLAYANTYGLPAFITHTMNCFGERQHPEKFIPKTIKRVLDGKLVEIHSDPTGIISGSRSYIHCRNVADAMLFLIQGSFVPREKYNIVGEREVSNLRLATDIADILGKPLKSKMVNFHESRPGHDLRYALCGEKMRTLGWQPPVDFYGSLEKTIRWTLDHKDDWL